MNTDKTGAEAVLADGFGVLIDSPVIPVRKCLLIRVYPSVVKKCFQLNGGV